MSGEPAEIRGSQIMGHTGEQDRSYQVKVYDFKRPDKFSLEQVHVFELIHQTIARGMTATLSTRVGCSVDVTVDTVDQMTFVEFVEAVPQVSAFAAVGLAPLTVPAVMQLDGNLATLLVDAACGQTTKALSREAPERPFTEIETLVLESVLEDFMPLIREGWVNAVELTPTVGAIESNPRNIQIVPPTELVILASLLVTIGGEQSHINVVFPYLTIEPIIHVLSGQYWFSKIRNSGGHASGLGTRARDIPVECEVAIPLPDVRLASLPRILDGEALPLRSLDRGLAELRAGTVPVAEVAYGATLADERELDLSLPSVARDRGRTGTVRTGGGGDDGAAAVVSHLDPALAELRGEIRGLRIAVEEMRQNRELTVTGDEASAGDPYSSTAFAAGTLRALDAPNEVAVLVASERAPAVAFLLAPLEPESASRLLAALPAELRDQSVRALSTLESADLALHARVMTYLKRRVRTRHESTVAGGPEAVAEILNHVPRSVEKAVMERFMAEDRPLFESIARLMFVFEDFALVDADAIRKVAERVGPDELALALKGVSKDVSSHVLGALREEDVAAVEAADAALGRVRRKDVETAQRDVIEELRRLEESGEVVVARPDEVVE